MNCKPKAKSLRASNGVELMSRFARSQPVLRASEGFGAPMNTTPMGEQDQGAFNNLQDTAVGGAAPGAPTKEKRIGIGQGAALLAAGNFHMEMPQVGMVDGGEASPFSLKGIGRSMGMFKTPQEKAAEVAAKYDAQSAALQQKQQAPAPAPVLQAPVQQIGNYSGNAALQGRMQAAGLRNGGEIHARDSFSGDLANVHNFLGDAAEDIGNYFSPSSMLPAPTQMAAPDRSGWGGVDRTPRRGYIPQATPYTPVLPQGSAPAPAPAPVAPAPAIQTAAPDDFAKNLSATGRAGFLARNPQMKARYDAEALQAKAAPAPVVAPTALRDQSTQQPWRTVNPMRTDSANNVITQDIYKQGNTYSDRPTVTTQKPAQANPTYSNVAAAKAAGRDTLGLLRGGDLRTGHGGVVPGTGTGDKIPAKYEPGEFVVSNDMLDAEPELRQHLRGLREEVLAEKGMTVAEADAKALNGGRGLRAESSLGDASVKAPTPTPKAAPTLALPDDSYGVNARNAGRAADVQREADVLEAAKIRAAEMHAASKSHADFEARKAAHGDGRYGLPPNPPANGANPAAATPAPTASTPASKFGKVKAIAGTGLRGVPMLGGAIETGLGIANGDARQTAWGVADTAAGAAMFNPVTAPIATPYLAMRGAYEGARALTDMASEYGLRDKNEAVRKMLEGTPPRNTQKPATSAAPVDTSDIEREKKNKAILDAAENLNAPGKPGETRNFDRNGNLLDKGQEMVYTGPKMGWQQRTSEAHLAKLNADDLKWRADNDRVAAAARARTAETLKRFEMQELLAQPMSKHRRAQVTELIKSRESNQVLRDNALLNADTLRTNNIETNQTTRRGHDLELEGKLAPAKLQSQIITAKAATLRGAGGDYTKAADLWALRGGDPKDFLEPAKAKAEAVRSAIDTDVAKANQGKGMFDGKFIAFDDDGKQLTDKWSEGHAEQLMAAAADSFRQTNKRDMTATEMKQHMNEIVAKTKAIAGMRKRAADRNNSMWNTVGLDKDVSLPTDIPNSAVDPEEVDWWDGLRHGAKVQRGDLRFGDQVLPGDTDADAKAYLLHIAQQRRAANKEK